MAIKVTASFVNVAQPALDTLRDETKLNIGMGWLKYDWHKRGSMVLNIFANEGRMAMEKHQDAFDNFFKTLRMAGFVDGNTFFDTVNFVDMGPQYCMCAMICNLWEGGEE